MRAARRDSLLATELTEISVKARSRNNAVLFDVELAMTPPEGFVMRSGYSAVARIRVDQARDVLVLPERLLEFRDSQVFVLLDDGQGGGRETTVELGLSDGLLV